MKNYQRIYLNNCPEELKMKPRFTLTPEEKKKERNAFFKNVKHLLPAHN